MHAGQNTKMKRGAIWACAIPVGLGVIGAILLGMYLMQVVPSGAGIMENILVTVPIIGCFIFGAPLSAWLACRSLAKINDANRLSRWWASVVRGLLSASLVHLIWSGLYIAGFVIIIATSDPISWNSLQDNPGLGTMPAIILGFVIMDLILWIIITLPLSLLCATIFWKVTKFPDDTNVF